jgi:hypothetical protein
VIGRLLRGLGGGRSPALAVGLAELEEFIAEVGGGRIGPSDVRPEAIYVPLVARDGERYVLRIAFTSYLAEPPRCSFVDGRYAAVPEAWPFPDPCGPFRSPHFICTPPTAEFYARHRERAYRPGEGSLVETVATVFAALNARQYAGRWGGKRRG